MSSRMWWFTVLVGPLAGLVILAHFIFNKTDPDGNRPLSFKGVMSYFLGHGVGWLIVFVVAISSITSGVTLVIPLQAPDPLCICDR
jgi:cytosine/uracil/thiamine/allantoin permease